MTSENDIMPLKNHENIQEFYIDKEWYKNRKKGISAMIRLKDEEEFIKPCLLSIKDHFDEIIITLNNCTDRTPQIIEELNLSNVKVFDYPFKLHHNGPGHNEIPENSVHDNAYFYNWTLSKTNYQHVCKWDGDMVAMPCVDKKFRKIVLKNNIVVISGIDISGEELAHQSNRERMNSEQRYFKVSKYTIYKQGELTQYFTHDYTKKIYTMNDSTFLHFKNVKSLKSATKIWPENWREIEHFQKLNTRREKGALYEDVYPEALKEMIIERAIKYARQVDELKSQEEVMRSMADILFEFRNKGLKGDVVEIGSFKGKTTVFLGRIMETLFPQNKLYSIDPYTVDGAEKSLHLDDFNQINDIYQSFISKTDSLNNHKHLRMPSKEAESKLPNNLIFSFIDGEHSYEAVKNDFEIMFNKTINGGIIAIDDFKNDTWSEVGDAYREIIKNRKLKIINSDIKAVYIMKKR